MVTTMKDSGERQQFETGAERQPTTGKGSFDLLPMLSLIKISKVMQAGACKYKKRNWENGIKLSRFFDSGMRHLSQFVLGFKDEEHLSQAIWNFMCLQETKIRIEAGLLPKELNDIPSEFFDNGDMSEKFGYLFDEHKLEFNSSIDISKVRKTDAPVNTSIETSANEIIPT